MSSGDIHTFKILTIGESGVGKTCILRRFVEDKFLKNHLATIGIDFRTKNISVDGVQVKLKIWDTAGQERFRNITNQYYKGADGIILVYDVTDRTSFEKIREWMNQIKQNTTEDEIGLVLLGNKCDADLRDVYENDGIELGKELGIQYFESSAMNNINISESFNYLAKQILSKKKIDTPTKVSNNKNLNTPQKKKKEGCC